MFKGIIGELRMSREQGVLDLEWKIDDVRSYPGVTGSFYNSPSFLFLNSRWYLRIYPYSDVGEIAFPEWIGLYLCKEEAFFPVDVLRYSFGVKTSDGSSDRKQTFTWKFDDGEVYGHPNLLKRSELHPEDSLTIVCIFKKASPPQEVNLVCAGLKNMFITKKFCDVTIHVGQQVFETHKVILVASSIVFAAMFEHEMSEKISGIVIIEDCDPESFKDFLHFLYTGGTDITGQNVIHLYKIAHKYNVEELMTHCVAYMLIHLSIENICDVVALGNLYSDVVLEHFCLEFLDENIFRIIRTPPWRSFLEDNHGLAEKLRKNAIENNRKGKTVGSKTKVKETAASKTKVKETAASKKKVKKK